MLAVVTTFALLGFASQRIAQPMARVYSRSSVVRARAAHLALEPGPPIVGP
jgi:hypothetical protein